jgi:hypothetical protein
VKLTFRQGIVNRQADSNGNSVFLQRAGQYINLLVAPVPTVLAFAHKTADYLVEELKTVQQAWGPITSSSTAYLYWDINLLTGALTRGFTLLTPIYTSTAPLNPASDQHWFDTVENVFKVYNGSKWVEKIRLFAGYMTSAAILVPYNVGTQAGLTADVDAGSIVLDTYGVPLRQSNGCFVTSSTWLNIVNLGTTTSRLETNLTAGMAAEECSSLSHLPRL